MSTAVTPVSDRKIEANRRNALLSTGPRTDAGKARSSQNAITHGIFCKNLIVAVDDPVQVRAFKREMLIALNPETIVEQTLVEQIIHDETRIQRVRNAERETYAMAVKLAENGGPASPLATKEKARSANKAIEQYQRYEFRLRGSISRAMKELREIQTKGLYRDGPMADRTRQLLDADPDPEVLKQEQIVAPAPAPMKNEATDSASVGEARRYAAGPSALGDTYRDIAAPAKRIKPLARPDRTDSDACAA